MRSRRELEFAETWHVGREVKSMNEGSRCFDWQTYKLYNMEHQMLQMDHSYKFHNSGRSRYRYKLVTNDSSPNYEMTSVYSPCLIGGNPEFLKRDHGPATPRPPMDPRLARKRPSPPRLELRPVKPPSTPEGDPPCSPISCSSTSSVCIISPSPPPSPRPPDPVAQTAEEIKTAWLAFVSKRVLSNVEPPPAPAQPQTPPVAATEEPTIQVADQKTYDLYLRNIGRRAKVPALKLISKASWEEKGKKKVEEESVVVKGVKQVPWAKKSSQPPLPPECVQPPPPPPPLLPTPPQPQQPQPPPPPSVVQLQPQPQYYYPAPPPDMNYQPPWVQPSFPGQPVGTYSYLMPPQPVGQYGYPNYGFCGHSYRSRIDYEAPVNLNNIVVDQDFPKAYQELREDHLKLLKKTAMLESQLTSAAANTHSLADSDVTDGGGTAPQSVPPPLGSAEGLELDCAPRGGSRRNSAAGTIPSVLSSDLDNSVCSQESDLICLERDSLNVAVDQRLNYSTCDLDKVPFPKIKSEALDVKKEPMEGQELPGQLKAERLSEEDDDDVENSINFESRDFSFSQMPSSRLSLANTTLPTPRPDRPRLMFNNGQSAKVVQVSGDEGVIVPTGATTPDNAVRISFTKSDFFPRSGKKLEEEALDAALPVGSRVSFQGARQLLLPTLPDVNYHTLLVWQGNKFPSLEVRAGYEVKTSIAESHLNTNPRRATVRTVMPPFHLVLTVVNPSLHREYSRVIAASTRYLFVNRSDKTPVSGWVDEHVAEGDDVYIELGYLGSSGCAAVLKMWKFPVPIGEENESKRRKLAERCVFSWKSNWQGCISDVGADRAVLKTTVQGQLYKVYFATAYINRERVKMPLTRRLSVGDEFHFQHFRAEKMATEYWSPCVWRGEAPTVADMAAAYQSNNDPLALVSPSKAYIAVIEDFILPVHAVVAVESDDGRTLRALLHRDEVRRAAGDGVWIDKLLRRHARITCHIVRTPDSDKGYSAVYSKKV